MKHIFWGRLFIPLIFGCLLFSPSWSSAAEISGTVFLPAGDTAPTKGLSVEVRVEDQNGGNEASTYADIPEGESAGTYSITVSDDPAASWIVHYYYFDNNYLKNGYYTNSGTSWDEKAATPLPGAVSHSEINLTLLRGNVINGTVYLPAAASQNTEVRIEITNLNRDAVDYAQTLYIDASQSSADYAIRVVNDPDASWEVKYTYYSDFSYVPDAYYQSPSVTTWNKAAATLLQGNQDYSGIDLTLLVGRTISGTVVLPNSATAPQDGISFDVYAVNTRNTEYSYSQWVTIVQDTNSISYTIRVPDDENATWQIHYETNRDDYLDKGYYAGAETTWDVTRATLLPGGQEHNDIDISLLPGSLIRGSLSLPPNTSGTGSVDIIISNGKGYTYTYPANLTYSTFPVQYNLRVANDPDSQWTVSYHYYYGGDYVNLGYYTPAGTTWNKAEASTLAGNQDHADIDLTLLEGNKLSGTISLPQNRTASDAVEIHLHARDASGSDRYGESSVDITQGESSTSYTISVPDDPAASWKIDYLCYSDHIFRRGYYADSGTTWNPAAATLLPGNTNQTATDITMLPGYEIFGRISLPNGATPPKGELNIGINAFDTHNDIHLPTEIFTIGGDKGDDPLWTYYAITVLEDDSASWQISYSYAGNEYLPAGYYAASGTTDSRSSATLLSGNQDYNDINLTLLHHKNFPWLLFLPAMISHSAK